MSDWEEREMPDHDAPDDALGAFATASTLDDLDALAEASLDAADPAPGGPDLDEALDGGADPDPLELLGPYGVMPVDSAVDERLARLEAAAGALADAERVREQSRVRRKVTAATTGAGAVGFVPVLLQLAGALELSPALAASASTAAAALGALAAGWATPERRAPAGALAEALTGEARAIG